MCKSIKEIHLLCNAHIDPVWLWQREEGLANAISTFRVAAQFCREYEGFVFNHNESVLYQWVEAYEPELFDEIRQLVKEGKWKIMGGWYLQPDCVMPSAESIVRQIEKGNHYFMEKFGVKPTTAINFDPFGHSRGLVQILKKCGYDSYLFMRPWAFIPEHDFIWKGYDGSTVLGHSIFGSYGTIRGATGQKLVDIEKQMSGNKALLLWGIGNHGGGPSRIDFAQIEEFQKKNPDIQLIHSWCEKYFSEVDSSNLRVVDKPLMPCMVGCYTSMVRIKQTHRKLENELNKCEKMLVISGISYNVKELQEAEEDLLFCEFHDILPGSMIRKGEEDALRHMNHGLEIIKKNCTKAFFKLCEGQNQAIDGEVPIFVFNPNPYWIETDVEASFILEDQNWTDNEVTLANVRDEKGNLLPTQNEKEDSSLNLDWCKKIVFHTKLKPMSLNRFDCELRHHPLPKRPIQQFVENDTSFIFQNKRMTVQISKETGLLEKYQVDDTDYLRPESGKLLVYQDNEDPWGMTVDGFYEQIGAYSLVSKEEANCFCGYPKRSYENVRVIENGDVRAKIQAIFRYENSYAIVIYTIPKLDQYVDIKIKTFTNDVSRMVKLSFNTCLKDAEFLGQTMFGREILDKEEREMCFQKWCGLIQEDKGFAILNKGTYGGSVRKDILNISLLRTTVYSGFPLENREMTESDRYNDRIDTGEREFEFRLTTNIKSVDAEAEAFNQPCEVLSYFPSGKGEKMDTSIEISNPVVIMSSLKKDLEGNLRVRLFNSSATEVCAELRKGQQKFGFVMQAYEAKTFMIGEKTLVECQWI